MVVNDFKEQLPTSMLPNFCGGSELREIAPRTLSRATLALLFTTTPNGELARGLKEQYLLTIINAKPIRPKGFLGDAFSGSVKALFTLQLYTMWSITRAHTATFLLYCIKRKDPMLPWDCSLIDHRRRQNV